MDRNQWATTTGIRRLDTDDEFKASFNNVNRLYNVLTGNLGYHTAHHHRQGLHWSKLPELHEKISHQIPTELVRNAVFMLPEV